MGVVANLGFNEYPPQGCWLGRRVKVCFHYDLSQIMLGTVVRDDETVPLRTIIKLDDGRYVLSTECMYSLVGDGPPTKNA